MRASRKRGVARFVAVSERRSAHSLLAGCGAAMLAAARRPPVVYALAVVFSVANSIARAQQHVLVTLVVTHADELTAANVATGWSEGNRDARAARCSPAS